MGCGRAVVASTINGLLTGFVVGVTLSLIKTVENQEKNLTQWAKEMVPQCTVVGAVVGFSYSMLSNCTYILQE